jgi:hypothetical protein
MARAHGGQLRTFDHDLIRDAINRRSEASPSQRIEPGRQNPSRRSKLFLSSA